MIRTTLSVLLLLTLSFSMYSCASPQFSKINVFMPKDFEMGNIEIRDKIPLRAGLYLSPAIKNYSKKGPLASAVGQVTFSMGDTLSSGSERMLRNIFKDIVIIDHMESDLSAKNIDVLIIPELIGIFGQSKVIEGKRGPQPFFQLVMKWNIVSLEGKNIYINTITGECPKNWSYSFTSAQIEEDERNNMLLLVRDHFQKAQDDIYSNAWWKKQWWKNNS